MTIISSKNIWSVSPTTLRQIGKAWIIEFHFSLQCIHLDFRLLHICKLMDPSTKMQYWLYTMRLRILLSGHLKIPTKTCKAQAISVCLEI